MISNYIQKFPVVNSWFSQPAFFVCKINSMIDKIALKESIDRICEETGFQLYDWHLKRQNKSHRLTVYITQPGGVSLDDCQEYSRLLGDELDMRDVITSRYFLEISSPGLERPLLNADHYKSAIGEEVNITYFDEEMRPKTVKGTLENLENDMITLKNNKGDEILINLSAIKKARTVFIWPGKSSESKSK